jgi:hypothetical protein
MWENIVEPERPQMTVWRMHIACWIPKATKTLSEHVMLMAFPLQQCTNALQCCVVCTLPVLLSVLKTANPCCVVK